MSKVNSFSRVLRYDNSYFYIIELGKFDNLYKYIIVNWNKNKLGKPMLIYSHTKRSALTEIEKNYFDNTLLEEKRIKKYFNQGNMYIGGQEKINNQPVKTFFNESKKPINYRIYIREANYILIELVNRSNINTYNIYEFITNNNTLDFSKSTIHTEKDLLSLEEDKDYVINKLLKKERVQLKIETNDGYVGTVSKVNGQYRKVENLENKIRISKR